MHEQPQIEIPGDRRPDRGPFSFALLLAAAALLIVLAGFFLWPGRQSPSRGAAQEVHPPFGPPERAYAAKIGIESLALSRAENFLHQEVTILAGELVNGGERPIRVVEVTVEFSDEMNQVVLRESRQVVNSSNPPFAPGERRPFDVSFEHISTLWNMQLPVVRVTGLLFDTLQ